MTAWKLRIEQALALLFLLTTASGAAKAADQTQWGEKNSRNMVSAETGLADSFDPKSGKNIKWRAQLGSQTYSTPTVGSGCVLIGTNNGNPRDPRQKGDRGVLMCFDEKDGTLRWQLVCPKINADKDRDWLQGGAGAPAKMPTDQFMDWPRDRVQQPRHDRGRPRLYADEPGRGRLPGPGGHGQRQRRPLQG